MVHEKPRALGRVGALVVVGFSTAMAVPVATTIAAPAASAAGCQTKLALIKGNPVEISCGPATAKLHFKGKTYSFKSGTCRRSSTGGTLSLGKNVDVKNNAGLVGMSIAFQGNGLHSAVVQSYQGGIYINDAAATSSNLGPTATIKTGTITGTEAGTPYTVSWNCGGTPAKE
jgi:hypothetical protein